MSVFEKSGATSWGRWFVSGSALMLAVVGMVACAPSTLFIDEGKGQPTDRASGKAPAGSIGACKVAFSKRPPLVNPALWQDLRDCNRRTPRRYLRLGYSKRTTPIEQEEQHMRVVLQAVKRASEERDGNVRMIQMLRDVKRIAMSDDKLSSRVERSTGRTFACDYAYLFNTTRKAQAKVQQDDCPAYVYNPTARRDQCLFDTSQVHARWLTSAWACLAFTETVGEGESCHRMCAYDDYCAGQVSCSQPDFDLSMCALGICAPEKIAGLY